MRPDRENLAQPPLRLANAQLFDAVMLSPEPGICGVRIHYAICMQTAASIYIYIYRKNIH